jgi:uncharacterized protein (DUF302 family)
LRAAILLFGNVDFEEDVMLQIGRNLMLVAALLCAAAVAALPAAAQDLVKVTKAAAYDDIRFELTNAIIGKGLVIDFNGRIGEMLERTGADIGATKKIYKQAEYFAFCSAKLSREAMEADPLAIAHCPYVVFLYETAEKPGEVVIGYRRPLNWGVAGEALRRVDSLLADIVRQAAK